MTLDDLHRHPLFEEVVQDSIAVQAALGLKLTDEFDEDTTLDELQFYITRVGFSLSHTLGWVQQLHQAVHFMTDFHYGKKATDAGVKKSHHLLYNVENYLIRIVSVYDRCLQLTNAVFHICMSDELVNHSAIVSNLHVSRTAVPKLLKAVKKAIKDEEQERHKLIHRHSHMDPELLRIELLYMHTKETWGIDQNRSYGDLVRIRGKLVKKFTNRRKDEFDTINANLTNSLGPLFDGLLIEYRRQKSRLKKLV
ncbi:Cthe_2314 family HEPN domain-containing protein [Burkholderia gladioli]|uniref:Cthe_2314 family HEPN domain-containing protein n=1 Tax=Burkholderia gladioli TaxID=28095 RepID=UPI00163FD273|nr:Cthe_2314 family HEPN domain-containing protein [Burkholderia gladioli]